MAWEMSSKASLSHGVKMLAHGPAGVGKTALVATLPRPCLISKESGMLTLAPQNIVRMFGANRTDICYDFPTYKINSVTDLMNIGSYFLNDPTAKRDYESIAFDSVSDIAEFALQSFLDSMKDGRQAYGAMAEEMTKVIKFFRDLPGFNVYFTSKQEREKDELGRIVKMPNMPGQKMSRDLPYLFDEVFALDIGTSQNPADKNNVTSYRYLRTRLNTEFFAKDRSGALAEIEEPHLGKIINKIRSNS